MYQQMANWLADWPRARQMVAQHVDALPVLGKETSPAYSPRPFAARAGRPSPEVFAMSKPIDILLLLALPASGKSEVRRFLAKLPPEKCRDDFHMGPTVQLDDYPYVHMMRRVSQHLRREKLDGVFFDSDEQPMKEPLDWGMLIELLNEDYRDLVTKNRQKPESAGAWLLDRFDACRKRVGAKAAFGALPPAVRAGLAKAIEAEAKDLLKNKNDEIPDSLGGKTIVMECARGGRQGSSMPLPAPYGYLYSLAQLSEPILERASILYVWVTPEESRRKNTERADPNDPGSILHHGVPMPVMLGDYGCDDMEWLIGQSDHPDTVRIEAHGKTFHLPVARFDNRKD
jgi:hypothetical protein